MPDSKNSQESPKKKKSKFGAWIGKGKTTWWRKNAPKFPGRTKSSNTTKFRKGLIGPYLNANSLVDFWDIFITPDVINLSVKYSNIVIATKKESYGKPCRVKDTDIIEMKALIGLLMLASACRSNRLNFQGIEK